MAEAGGPPRLALEARVARITLARPAQGNRLEREDLAQLLQHFAVLQQAAQAGTVRVLVLAAEGPQFCTGFHLGELSQLPESAHADADPQRFEQVVQALEALPLPSIARLQGGVYGGATDLALACDFRVGTPALRLRMPAVRLGLHFYASGLQRFVSRLGPAAARRLFLLAEELDAPALQAIGYLDLLVDPAALDAEVQALALALLAGAPQALAATRESINEIARGEADPARLRAREAASQAGPELAEGLAAWAERRPARWG